MRLEGTALEPLIKQLYDELSAKGLAFQPPCYIGDEWFVPIGVPAIFIPFFLVHDRLRALEQSMMLEVEGETREWFMTGVSNIGDVIPLARTRGSAQF